MPCFTVGLCMMQSKLKKLDLPGCLAEPCSKYGIKLVVIDPSVPIHKQGKFDVIVQKVIDFKAFDKANGTRCYENAREHFFSRRTPCILEPLELALNLADREWTMKLAAECQVAVNGIRVFVPKFLSITEEIDTATFERRIDAANLRYPVLVKQQMAAGSKIAHVIALVFCKENLSNVATPCLIQEFVKHGGIMYKIFLLGDRHYIVERPSLRNLEAGDKPTEQFLSFDVSKLNSCSKLHDDEIATTKFRTSDDTKELLDPEVVQAFISRLRSTQFEFNLLGIDVLVEEETGNYGIVDLNYFPGYDGAGSHFAEDMTELMRSKCYQYANRLHINGTHNGH